MKIEHPSENSIPQLRGLWQNAFGDEDAYLDLFFSTAFSPDRCRCVMEDGAVLAALYWFNASCCGAAMAYLYAVATAPAARGRGLCRSLMEDTRNLLTRRGYAGILLKPADAELRRMYQKMGYTPCTTISARVFEAGARETSLRRIGAGEYSRLRREYLPDRGVVQEGVILDFLAAQAELYAGEDFLAAVSIENGEFLCHELLGRVSAAPGLLRALSCDRGQFFFPGNEMPFASFCPLTPGCPVPSYFGLALG